MKKIPHGKFSRSKTQIAQTAQRRPRVKLLLGFDLGGTKLASAVTTYEGRVLAQFIEPVDFSSGPSGFLSFLENRARYWLNLYPEITALGIASCGPLDSKNGRLLQPTNFPRWGTISIARPLKARLKMPVAIQNDAAAVAAAEGWVGGAKKLKNWAVLTFGTGLGTGIIMDRNIFMGGSGQGPEVGHMIVSDQPYLCGCGNYGCAEAVLSGTALKRRIRERSLPVDSPHGLVDIARSSKAFAHDDAQEIFKEFAHILARTVHNIAVMYKPKKIFIAGGLGSAHDLYLGAAQKEIGVLLKSRKGFTPKLVVSALGETAGVLGGAWVARFMGDL